MLYGHTSKIAHTVASEAVGHTEPTLFIGTSLLSATARESGSLSYYLDTTTYCVSYFRTEVRQA
ncbi:hypothetical protein NITHO_3310017 [Nitrolancea hollandica Lb]|uniref:Uncharacterized protein n=1 Tax=Nitrolancea hollandica Lb TaxID=1129897 RepID=I4EHY8_9BACT|nr:hypothetical protein NITHO_3310017 [Nitrolancea hollandica Lb]